MSAGPDRGEERAAPDLPPSYNMAAPLNETELMALLMASPLYQKLENIRKTIEKGSGGSAQGKESTQRRFYFFDYFIRGRKSCSQKTCSEA